MKDVKSYIESGILELYVLGDVSPAEKLEVEAMAQEHPAVKAELAEIEQSMELFAEEHEIEPAPELRDRILNSLLTNLADDSTFRTKNTTVTEAKVVTMVPPTVTNNAFYKYAFAACFALLLVSTAAIYNLYSKLEQSNTQILALSTQSQQLSRTVNDKNEELKVFRDTAYRVINLQGTEKAPDASLSVAWSPAKKKVVIDLNGMKMPETDAEHQYQLWAIVAGKPVSLGVFDSKKDSAEVMKVMASVDKPQAFAVTLEKRGGVASPTMDKMMVIKMI